MEKRFVLFIVLTMLVLTGHVFLQSMFALPRPPDADQLAEMDPNSEDPSAAPEDPTDLGDPGDSAGEKGLRGPEAQPDADIAAAGNPAAADVPAVLPELLDESGEPALGSARERAPEWFSFGSYSGTAGPLLVTFTSQGAGLVRIELVPRNADGELIYRNLEETSGYLGHLALTSEGLSGCRVNVVGHGTPAALAVPVDATNDIAQGLQPGDVITAVTSDGGNGERTPLESGDQLERYLESSQAGDVLVLSVRRVTDEQADEPTEVDFRVQLAERPFQVLRPEPRLAEETEPHPASCLMRLVTVGGERISDELAGEASPLTGVWEATRLEGEREGVEFRFRMPDGGPGEGELELVKRFRMPAADAGGELNRNYHLEMEVEVVNLGSQKQQLQYELNGPNGLPLEGWWYAYKTHPKMFYSAGARDILYRRGSEKTLVGCSAIYKKAAQRPENPVIGLLNDEVAPIDYLAVDTQYFLSALLPAEGSGTFTRADALLVGELKPKRLQKTSNVSFRVVSPAVTIPAEGRLHQQFELFVGPKQPAVLAAYGLDEAIYYGWFGAVAKPLSSVLHFFYALVGNYGIAIIMLTILVRGCMFPLSRKAAKNAAMMQELAPEMKAITEKYKGDMEKRAKAQQELFRRHNYNPLGGCWVMFLQLPIFIGLYRSLSVDIELRQAALIPGIDWCSNLAGPDQLFYWGDWSFFGLFEPTGMLGPYFNILPLGTVALFLVQQKMFSPPATDDQTRMQLQVMKFMTLFIGIMFFKVASGLCLYFIASSIWGIAERKLLPKKNTVSGDEATQPEKLPESKPRPAARNPQNGASQNGGKSKRKAKRRQRPRG